MVKSIVENFRIQHLLDRYIDISLYKVLFELAEALDYRSCISLALYYPIPVLSYPCIWI